MSSPLLSRVANPGDHIEITMPDNTTIAGDLYKIYPPRGRKNGGVVLWQLVNADAPSKKSSYKAVKVEAIKGANARLVR